MAGLSDRDAPIVPQAQVPRNRGGNSPFPPQDSSQARWLLHNSAKVIGRTRLRLHSHAYSSWGMGDLLNSGYRSGVLGGGAAVQTFRDTGIASSVLATSLVAVSIMTTSGSAAAADLPFVKAP